jgi:hypothetical protein
MQWHGRNACDQIWMHFLIILWMRWCNHICTHHRQFWICTLCFGTQRICQRIYTLCKSGSVCDDSHQSTLKIKFACNSWFFIIKICRISNSKKELEISCTVNPNWVAFESLMNSNTSRTCVQLILDSFLVAFITKTTIYSFCFYSVFKFCQLSGKKVFYFILIVINQELQANIIFNVLWCESSQTDPDLQCVHSSAHSLCAKTQCANPDLSVVSRYCAISGNRSDTQTGQIKFVDQCTMLLQNTNWTWFITYSQHQLLSN